MSLHIAEQGFSVSNVALHICTAYVIIVPFEVEHTSGKENTGFDSLLGDP